MPKKQLYFIALMPHEALREKVKSLKEEMRERFDAKHALKSPAHLTLQMPFRWPESEETHIFNTLTGFAAQQQPFRIALSGFDCFEPRVLFIRIVDHAPFQHLCQSFKPVLIKQLGIPEHMLRAELHPHLTIATRDLKEAAFYKAWPEFQLRRFEASFEANSLFLLKHNGRCWEVYREFAFKVWA